jgi:hypothetical protein
MNIPSKRGLGMVLLMAVTFSHAQITTADNGLTATGTAPNKNVSLGGTLTNAPASIDFGNSNTSSNFLFKKGTSNYFFIGNDGKIGIGITAPTANLHVIQNSASQTGLILKSHSDAQTANTFEVQDAAGTAVLKVRGTQDWTYGQAAVSINQGNKTNNPALSIHNIGSGISGIALGGVDGGSVLLTDFDLHHSPTWTYTNKHAKWRVINNAFDGPSVESYSFEHQDQPATMNLMTLKGQTSQTGDMLRIKNGGGTDIFRVKAAGGGYFADNVGIGVASPTAKLHTSGTVRLEGLTNDNAQTRVLVSDANGNVNYRDASSLGSGGSVSGSTNYIAKYSSTTSISNSLLFDNGTNVGVGTATPNTNAKLDVNGNIFSSGKIAIGTTDMAKISTYSLAVNGDALFNKVKVKLYANWPDYVFEMDYPLPTLLEVEQFIQKNKHLPGVPSAKEVEKNGLDIGDNQAVLLKKIEELTLYVIAQGKLLEAQEKRIRELEKPKK